MRPAPPQGSEAGNLQGSPESVFIVVRVVLMPLAEHLPQAALLRLAAGSSASLGPARSLAPCGGGGGRAPLVHGGSLPGGGVMGAAGHNAAQVVFRDLKSM